MSEMYDSLIESLTEEVEDIKKYGKSQGKRTVMEIVPVNTYSAADVKSIRKKTGLSQAVFAKCIGVSKKTVEAWEEGVNIPSGPASRILDLVGDDTISVNRYLVTN